MSKKQRERVESLLDESYGLRLFLQDCVRRDPDASLTTAEIVESYAHYCMNKGWDMSTGETEKELPDLMMEMFQVAKSHNVPSPNSKSGVRGYGGVDFI